MSVESLTPADRVQYARDAPEGEEQGRRNAERARSEVVALRRPTPAEPARLRG